MTRFFFITLIDSTGRDRSRTAIKNFFRVFSWVQLVAYMAYPNLGYATTTGPKHRLFSRIQGRLAEVQGWSNRLRGGFAADIELDLGPCPHMVITPETLPECISRWAASIPRVSGQVVKKISKSQFCRPPQRVTTRHALYLSPPVNSLKHTSSPSELNPHRFHVEYVIVYPQLLGLLLPAWQEFTPD